MIAEWLRLKAIRTGGRGVHFEGGDCDGQDGTCVRKRRMWCMQVARLG